MIKLSRAVKHRSGDGASSRAGAEKYRLSDRTEFGINIEVVFYPKDEKKICWYISIWSQDKNRKHASGARYGKNVNNKIVRKIYSLAIASKNLLASHPHKVRKRIIDGWMKSL